MAAMAPYDRFRQYLAEKRFCEAFQIIDDVVCDVEGVGEGAAAHEWYMLLDMTAAVGDEDWRCIFESSDIPREYKIALVDHIAAAAYHQARSNQDSD